MEASDIIGVLTSCGRVAEMSSRGKDVKTRECAIASRVRVCEAAERAISPRSSCKLSRPRTRCGRDLALQRRSRGVRRREEWEASAFVK